MPFIRYKPWKVFGRYNTRRFRELLRVKNLERFPRMQLDPEFVKRQVKVHDPTKPEFYQLMLMGDEGGEGLNYELPPHLASRRIEDHELYKQQPCYLFDGTSSMTDGVAQACSLINATSAKEFPSDFFTPTSTGGEDLLPADFEWHVRDAIMHGERYDPTLEKLPKRFDPIIWWMSYSRVAGTPVTNRATIILTDLVRKILMFSATKSAKEGTADLHSHLRLERNPPISAYLPAENSGLGAPWVLRQQPGFALHTFADRPLSLMANKEEVEETRSQQVPDIYPISPLNDLSLEQVYNDHAVVPAQAFKRGHLNCLFMSREQSQKYPWSRDENAANVILHCFGGAVAQATRNLAKGEIVAGEVRFEKPVVMKSAQLVDGRLDLAMVQVNTLRLDNEARFHASNADAGKPGSVKNLVWLEKSVPLYKPKPFYENMDEVKELNMETATKFARFLLYQ